MSTEPQGIAYNTIEQATIDLTPVDDQVYRLLRSEIIQGLIPQDTVLRLRELASRFNVSTTPVREALERLKTDGLCVQEPHRGTRVVSLSGADFADIYAVRIGLEGYAVRLGLARMGPADVAKIREVWQGTLALWDDGGEPTLDEYLPYMNRITMTCIEFAGAPKLQALVLDYRRFAERYLRVALTDLEFLRDDALLQEEIVIACEARDPERAELATRNLLVKTMEDLRGRLLD
ncbi:transcriptional regulator, GntR family [Agrococcus baldri]|uniref:Transcriptional regulator, GntR family n=1 Tax=Agrococcus baldri TaxID=153730 RepID=A0AA94HMQ1_9MICO|nr:GntR family transcriptional regulator [Agrococcus baldri]SFS11827.1 transcriptional regulator, GntR family [Agrococcus baldri]